MEREVGSAIPEQMDKEVWLINAAIQACIKSAELRGEIYNRKHVTALEARLLKAEKTWRSIPETVRTNIIKVSGFGG
jgi:hypothetical protein